MLRSLLLSCLACSVLFSSCKTVSEHSQEKLIGGVPSELLPQVGILARNGEMHCTASLIAPLRVVTAAHCIKPWIGSSDVFTFHVGPTLAQSQSFAITKLVPHPLYDPEASNNDIAYAELAEAPPYAPLPVLEGTEQLNGEHLQLLGYGRNTSPLLGRDQSSGIKRVGTTLVREVAPGKIKAELEGVSSCNGDSGGPAFIEKQGVWSIAGIVSCGDAQCGSYGVYTKISAYRQFLGLNSQEDPILKALSCGGVDRRGRCDQNLLLRCSDDCYAAKPERIDCSTAQEGRCVTLKTDQRAACADASWREYTLQAYAIKKENGRLKSEPWSDLELFIDSALVSPSSRSQLRSDRTGKAQEVLSPGLHSIRAKSIYSSHSIGVSTEQIFAAKQSEEPIFIYFGKVPTDIWAKVSLPADESLYITGESPLLGEWKTAYRMNPARQGWVYHDLLTSDLEFKVIRSKATTATISTQGAAWELGPNHKLEHMQIAVGIEEEIEPSF